MTPTHPHAQPVLFDPKDGPKLGNPDWDDFLFEDEDFPEETDPRWALHDPRKILRTPHFTMPETAAWVFAKDGEWIKGRFRTNPPALNGQELEFRRLIKGRRNNLVGHHSGGGERRLTIPDIERLAWVLFNRHYIDGIELQRAMDIIVTVARQHGVEPRQIARKKRIR